MPLAGVPTIRAAIPTFADTDSPDLNGNLDLVLNAIDAQLLTLIADTTLGAPAATILLSSIPQTSYGLLLEWELASDQAGVQNVSFQVNGDTTAGNHGMRDGYADGFSTAWVAAQITGTTMGAQYRGTGWLLIHDYAQTTKVKMCVAMSEARIATTGTITTDLTRANSHGVYGFAAGFPAVTSLKLFPAAGNFIAGSRVRLWGLP